ncbi:MAG TPA: hypothetical protein VGC69_01410 [Bordetella sp.]
MPVISILLAFAASSIDDFILLVCLYADRRAGIGEITGAKMICVLLALGAAIACATTWLALPLSLSRAMGLAPLALGIKRLIDHRRPRAEAGAGPPGAYAHMGTGTLAQRTMRYVLTLFAASLDNVVLYLPLFAQGHQTAIVSTIGIVLALTLSLCGIALLCSRIPIPFHAACLKLGAAVPYLMMYIGIKALAASWL